MCRKLNYFIKAFINCMGLRSQFSLVFVLLIIFPTLFLPLLNQGKVAIDLKYLIESSNLAIDNYKSLIESKAYNAIQIHSYQIYEINISLCSIQVTRTNTSTDDIMYHKNTAIKESNKIRNLLLSLNNKEQLVDFFGSAKADIEEYKLYSVNSEKILKIDLLIEKDGTSYTLTIFIFLGGRLDGVDVLVNDKRRKIFEYIKSNPGAYFREIMRVHSLGPNWVKYHLDILEDHGYIRRFRFGQNLTYFTVDAGIDENQAKIHIILQNKNIQNLLKIIISNPGITSTEIREKISLHRNTIGYNLNKLFELGMLKEVKQRGQHSFYPRDY